MFGLIKKIVGTRNEREIKRLAATVDLVNAQEAAARRLSDAALRGKTVEFRERLGRGEELDALLPEAFAVVREAARRTIGMRHFDVQILGGVVLHEGKIAEMKTGEGKTLVATLPVYLNALPGKGVHVVTVNDYLAKRDSQWMGQVYRFLGLTVGLIQHDLQDRDRQVAYGCDVTFGTNNEYGFDYLRDNMKFSLAEFVQRELHFAIVDEVDSILIDEARTPLIISGPVEESTDIYYRAVEIAEPMTGRRITDKDEVKAKFDGTSLEEGVDYVANEKNKSVSLTEQGETRACRAWGVESLHDLDQMEKRHVTLQALRAKEFYKRDVEYVVNNGEVIIVDEFTGRLMPGRRWSEGLHQVVEARENRIFQQPVRVAEENQTLATITFQNYFRLYKKLAGMTGTADTEAPEFAKTYKMDVVTIPTNRPLVRINHEDMVYRTEREKFDAVVKEIQECTGSGRPALVGTISIEKSEHLSKLLKRTGVRHQVLNAKYHEREAEIISQAGRLGAVTIATNMAGRGTDILLGGNPEALARQRHAAQGPEGRSYEEILAELRAITDREHDQVVAAGGLHIIGTERHESRRIDNQLRGRAGRQGDPGSSRFFLSLEDDLMRIFGSDRISGLMGKIGMEEGEPIEHRFVTRAIENAQKRVEAHNFEVRKQLLEYDDVMNEQRSVIYAWRRQVLAGEIGREDLLEIIDGLIDGLLAPYAAGGNFLDAEETAALAVALRKQFSLDAGIGGELGGKHREELRAFLVERVRAEHDRREAEFGAEAMGRLRQFLMLQIIDSLWKEHLYAMDSLKEGIGLRGYGQKNPLTEYKKEAFDMFDALFQRVREDVVEYLFAARPVREEELPVRRRQVPREERHESVSLSASARQIATQEAGQAEGGAQFAAQAPRESRGGEGVAHTVRRAAPKVGRNDPCPCGSGKKYKKCCGLTADHA
ncbi:MAG TPA: preprotein translocase subunit SecA [bacterium]